MALECKILDQSRGADCIKKTGGIRLSLGIDWENVGEVTVTSGKISAITLSGAGNKFAVVKYEKNNTASYAQTGQKNGTNVVFQEVAVMNFDGPSDDQIVIANKAKGVSSTLWIHFLNNGLVEAQGVELNSDGTKGIESHVSAMVVPTLNSNTGEGSSTLSYSVESTTSDIIPVDPALTEAALIALVGA